MIEYIDESPDYYRPPPALIERPTVKFKRLHKDAVLPKYQTSGAAGMDLTLVEYPQGIYDPEDGPQICCFGLSVEIPPGYEGTIRPRSSISKRGFHVYWGTIDSDYRGELMCCVQQLYVASRWRRDSLNKGDRIAQLVIAPVAQANIVEVEELSSTVRGTGGFGSTGR